MKTLVITKEAHDEKRRLGMTPPVILRWTGLALLSKDLGFSFNSYS
jgi:hypothetical protein